ncbi:hypothetical protein Mbo2_096 [Rhodococcus phage Mbo2]|uniref:Uncharacterized protein n=1 Tax=Rhodococcus phage Mbo2 TaxID=2936911 RepID=A0A9E7IMF5_9CAUD|nr:hypothetical protein Mbo2_096 [Rhodococcus phage Mbo2]
MLGYLLPRYHAARIPGVTGPDRYGVKDTSTGQWLEYRTRRKSAARERARSLNNK